MSKRGKSHKDELGICINMVRGLDMHPANREEAWEVKDCWVLVYAEKTYSKPSLCKLPLEKMGN